ncbi:DNA-directed RNA polymerase subunit beta [Candidatus Kuenenbacteria bacterium HGW-Kuenenbacteria-1]|uniref:DNA-directed RNA polymerase subunit beta n=1 Tax=Candidatus Kuenenbacteria bacterium HGW-Kuenenbacteria-1 TaxID=2013812 RepID=A0A2N1UNH9_9BACT|nr:MAG: DNA-directed RNA polymerase subunit beta [Candidatus Kuenenbacteria bacterium HGW-Kuenenbacteria-1]
MLSKTFPKTFSKRVFFNSSKEIVPLPNLIKIQKKSYEWFLKDGLKELFEEISPIKDYIGRDLELYFKDYYFDDPKFDETTAKERNITYEAPLRVKVELVNKKTNKNKIQEIFFGDFPLMTKRGTFIINGIERVVVSQLVRSAGVFFSCENSKGKFFYGAKIIPNRGAWIEIETDGNGILWVRIDRKRKIAITALLKAFGYGNDEEILDLFKEFKNKEEINYIKNTLLKDSTENMEDGLIEVYKHIRPGDMATPDNAKSLIYAMFFNFSRYDLGGVGRYKINQTFKLDTPITKENRILKKEDLINIIKRIISLNVSQEKADDIDHLNNRRVRAIGELLQNKLRIGLTRMERIVKDRMSTYEIETIIPNSLVNVHLVSNIVREFFMSFQLSQFMDQVNLLAELEHKRRLSAMGPGGLSRERAGFEVRDVHYTHYGRICPVTTPEGTNIGLISHLACYAEIDDYGFLKAPFVKIINKIKNKAEITQGKVIREDILDPITKKTFIKKGETITLEIAKKLEKIDIKEILCKPFKSEEAVYLDATEEEKYVTTSAGIILENKSLEEKVEARIKGQAGIVSLEEIDLQDISPKQIISVSAALIPFLEHNDAARALMGSNMQRQAVACIKAESPIVGTGMEAKVALDSGYLTIAENDGIIEEVEASKITILEKNNKSVVYPLQKFLRSNASTCLNQKVLIEKGQEVKKGDILADGTDTQNGEIALGQNILVAFISFEGGNFEDAILISEKLVQEDRYTSIHIEDYKIDVRDTKLGPEVITNDIPNISEEKLKNLDNEGIIRIGAEVFSGDILVGKITPKGETELSAEEKLLKAIFGEKAKDVRDSSLYLKHGEHGKVINVKIFSREQGDKLSAGVIKTIQISIANLRRIQVGDKLAGRHGNKGVISRVVAIEDMPYLKDGTPIDMILNPLGVVSRMNLGQILEITLGLAAKTLNYKVASPSLDGVTEEKIKEELEKAGFSKEGKVVLCNGKSGENFVHPITIGYPYFMKLNHLVEDKIHQRSIGPYSLITQQPLGGKAQFGGQRFGEMEVWALEAYGAAHTLQEILTIKSDDVLGRSKAYETIIKDGVIEKVNLPESFNVLVRELKGLCLDVELFKKK